MKKILYVVMLVMSFVLLGCGELSVSKESSESQGQEKKLRVAVYDMGILDIMDNIGFEKFNIGTLSIPEYLAKGDLHKYSNYGGPDLGLHHEPTIEPLKLLQPDVVILTNRFRSLEDQIRKEFPKAIVYQAAIDPTKYVEGLIKNYEFLENTFPAVKDELKASETELTTEIAEFQELTKDFNQKSLILMPNGKSIATYGSGGRFDMIHSTFGFPDVLDDKDLTEDIQIQATSSNAHGNNINYEFFTQVNPDIVFLIDRNLISNDNEASESIQDLMNSSAFKNTNAFKNKKIISLDPNAFYVYPGGFNTTKVMMEGLKKALN